MKCANCLGSGCIACDWRGTTHDGQPATEYTRGGSYTLDAGGGIAPASVVGKVSIVVKEALDALSSVAESPPHLVLEPKENFKEPSAGVRTFSTGANRSAVGDKPDYEGFLSPLALVRFGEYMHKHRKLPDGSLRDSDNWQRGIPIAEYVKSLFRHFVAVWCAHRQGQDNAAAQEDNLCAIIFNAQGLLHEILKARAGEVKTVADPFRFFVTQYKDVLVSRSPEDLGYYIFAQASRPGYESGLEPSVLHCAKEQNWTEVSRAGAERHLGFALPPIPPV